MYKLKKEFEVDVQEIRKYQTPAAPGLAVRCPTANEQLISAVMQRRFWMAVWLMLFLVKFSCPDISNLVKELAKVNDGAQSCEICAGYSQESFEVQAKVQWKEWQDLGYLQILW